MLKVDIDPKPYIHIKRPIKYFTKIKIDHRDISYMN